MLAVLETGVYRFPETWGFTAPFVGSLRPLKMVRVQQLMFLVIFMFFFFACSRDSLAQEMERRLLLSCLE